MAKKKVARRSTKPAKRSSTKKKVVPVRTKKSHSKTPKGEPTVVTIALPNPEKKSRLKYFIAMCVLFALVWYVGFCMLTSAFGTEEIRAEMYDVRVIRNSDIL